MSGPKWDPKKPIVPLGADGSLLSYPGYGQGRWEEFVPFTGTLYLEGTERGRSSLLFIWKSKDGRRWPMFATHVADLIERGDIELGRARGTWTAAKRGANYGIRLAP